MFWGVGQGLVVGFQFRVRLPGLMLDSEQAWNTRRGPNKEYWPLVTLRVQVPNNHILTQILYYNCYYPNPKYLVIGHMDPLAYVRGFSLERPICLEEGKEPGEVRGSCLSWSMQ